LIGLRTIALVVLYGGIVLWLLSGAVRLLGAWEISQRQTSELRLALAGAGRKLLSGIETIQKLDDEIKRVKDQAATAVREQKERQQVLAKSPPKLSPEIHVTSEFPPSRKDRAWIVEFARDPELPPLCGERELTTSLVWARDDSAALLRARQLTSDYKMYSVQSVRMFL
jgi:hypothetical protein